MITCIESSVSLHLLFVGVQIASLIFGGRTDGPPLAILFDDLSNPVFVPHHA